MRVNCPKCSAHAEVTTSGLYRNAQDLRSSDFLCIASPGNASACTYLGSAIQRAIEANELRRAGREARNGGHMQRKGGAG